MHYRLTTMKFRADKRDAFLAYADSIRGEMKAITGIQSVVTVETAPGEAVVIASYDKMTNAMSAAPKVQKIMGGMAEFFVAPPIQLDGPQMWKM